ncbi:LOW QUALITY PROTEIN: trans-2-enoyl-CoA reductase [Colletotrichum tofieldiae]|nr:LOW QUALITY PROTEIN: trans-2-enoyl-CoA reductase [Colletotrichum tofieldiae]
MIITQSKSPNGALARINFHYPQPEPATQALDPGKILVSFLFSPINPQDLLVIAGRYPVKPSYKHEGEPVLGYDAVARIEAVGSDSSTSSAQTQCYGPEILLSRAAMGWGLGAAVLEAADVIRLTPTNDLIGASLLRMAFLPAYLLVEDIRTLKPGDWVVQNVGSGTIARLVAQFARIKGVHTVSVVRDRDSEVLQSLKGELLAEGASVVISESDLREHGIEAHPDLADAAGRKRVVLAIDGVFGEPGERLASLLSQGGTFVNYGSLGGADGVVRLSQRLLFWSEIRFQNFRLSERLSHRTPEQQESLLLWFQDLLTRGVLVTPKVRRIQAPVSAGDQAEFEHSVTEAVSPGSEAGVGNVKRVLEFKRTLVRV